MKLDKETIRHIETALAFVEFGEVIIVIHDGKIQGIDVKNRKRVLDKYGQRDVDSS